MSTHILSTTSRNGLPVSIQTGWDSRRAGFFLTVNNPISGEQVYPAKGKGAPAFPKEFDAFEEALNDIGVRLPCDMFVDILRDGECNVRNKEVVWSDTGEILSSSH